MNEAVGTARDEEIRRHVALEPFDAIPASVDHIVLEPIQTAFQKQLDHGSDRGRDEYHRDVALALPSSFMYSLSTKIGLLPVLEDPSTFYSLKYRRTTLGRQAEVRVRFHSRHVAQERDVSFATVQTLRLLCVDLPLDVHGPPVGTADVCSVSAGHSHSECVKEDVFEVGHCRKNQRSIIQGCGMCILY